MEVTTDELASEMHETSPYAAIAPILVVAFGTRGDVQPLAVLASALFKSSGGPVWFLTHDQHRSWILRDVWTCNGVVGGCMSSGGEGIKGPGADGDGSSRGLQLVSSPSPPCAPPSANRREGKKRSPRRGGEPGAPLADALRPPGHFDACVAVVDACRRPDAELQGADGDNPPSSQPRARLVVMNLFALEGWHMAEALDAPVMVAHPYPPPRPIPPASVQRFRVAYTRQSLALVDIQWRQQRQDEREEEAEEGSKGSPRLLSWWDVENWLWPVFGDHWTPLRHRLGLPGDPNVVGVAAPPMLHLYSPQVLPPPGCWPANVHVTGYLWPPSTHPSYVPHAEDQLLKLLRRGETTARDVGPIYVSFGSMVALGGLGRSRDVSAMTLACAVEASGCKDRGVIVDAAGDEAWAQAICRAMASHSIPAAVLTEYVPHDWLLPQCSVVVHHGGSGTTAAALRAGVAQVTIPMLMDQFMWAERVSWLGLGPEPLKLTDAFPDDDADGEDGRAGGCDGEESLQAPPAAEMARDTPSIVASRCTRSCESADNTDDTSSPANRTTSSAVSNSNPLSQAIASALSVPSRLRAASFGRKLREEPDGSAACISIITSAIGTVHHHVHRAAPAALTQAGMVTSFDMTVPAGCRLHVLDQEGVFAVAASEGSDAEISFLCDEIWGNDTARPAADAEDAPQTDAYGGGSGCVYLRHGVTVKEGDVVMDVGAHVGLFGLYLHLFHLPADAVEPVTVVAIEPSEVSFSALLYNLNRYTVPHVAIHAAIADRTDPMDSATSTTARTATLLYYPHMPGNSSVVRGRSLPPGINEGMREYLVEGGREEDVRVVTLEDLVTGRLHDITICSSQAVSGHVLGTASVVDGSGMNGKTDRSACERSGFPRVDLLKVDVEGAEESVLASVGSAWPRIQQCVAEVHDVDGAGYARARIETLLRERAGFDVVIWERPEWASSAGTDNWIVYARRSRKEEDDGWGDIGGV